MTFNVTYQVTFYDGTDITLDTVVTEAEDSYHARKLFWRQLTERTGAIFSISKTVEVLAIVQQNEQNK